MRTPFLMERYFLSQEECVHGKMTQNTYLQLSHNLFIEYPNKLQKPVDDLHIRHTATHLSSDNNWELRRLLTIVIIHSPSAFITNIFAIRT